MALAEERFLSQQHVWKFDSAWQEMLNNAILKVFYNLRIVLYTADRSSSSSYLTKLMLGSYRFLEPSCQTKKTGLDTSLCMYRILKWYIIIMIILSKIEYYTIILLILHLKLCFITFVTYYIFNDLLF